MTLTGDYRRWANEPGIVGRRPLPGHPPLGREGAAAGRGVASRASRTSSSTRAPHTIAAVFLETVVGTNGILIPPDGYLAGRPRDLRPLRDPDGRATRSWPGFGRTGRWFAVDHWDVVPGPHDDGQGPHVVATCRWARSRCATTSPRRSTRRCSTAASPTSSHPVSLAAALATIEVYEEDDLIGNAARMGEVMRGHHEELAGEAPERRRAPQHRPVRHPGPRPQPGPVDAAHAVQRDQRRDEGDRQVLPRQRPVHDDRQQLDQ